MGKRSCKWEAAWLRKHPPVRITAAATSVRKHEYFAAIYSSAHRHLVADDGAFAGGHRRLPATTDLRSSAGGLSDHSGRDLFPGRQPRCDRVFDRSEERRGGKAWR